MTVSLWEALSHDERTKAIRKARSNRMSWAEIAEEVGLARQNKSTVYQWAQRNVQEIFKEDKKPKKSTTAEQLQRQLNLTFHALQQQIHSELQDILLPQLDLQLKANRRLIQAIWINIQDELSKELTQRLTTINEILISIYNILGNLQKESRELKTATKATIHQQFEHTLLGAFPTEAIGEELAQSIMARIGVTDQTMNLLIQELASLRQTGVPPGAIDLQVDFRALAEDLQAGFTKISNELDELTLRPPMIPMATFSVKSESIHASDEGLPEYAWDEMQLEEIEAIPQTILEQLSLAEIGKMRARVAELQKLEAMSPEERQEYLRKTAEEKARVEAVQAKNQELRDSNFFRIQRAKADAETAGGVRGMFGKVTSRMEYWWCLVCHQKFAFAATRSQKRPAKCDYCGNGGEENLVRYSPIFEME